MMSSANHSHLQAYEDIIGVGAVRILENLIQQHQQRSESLQESNTNADQPTKDTLALLQEFQPLQTVDRWLQQVQMVYIPLIAATKAVKLEQEIKNRLTEIYQESNQEEDVEMTDTEKFNHDMGEYFENAQEGNSGLLDDHIEDETEEEEEDEEEGVVVLDPEVEEEEEIVLDPVFVTINGEQVDISGTGIDVEFLEALPDDLRAEVYSQAVAERRISVQSMDEDALNAEFLAALPVDMRDELLRQEDRERSRREQREHSSHPTENEPATANSRQVSQADAPMHSNVQDALELIGFDAIESSNAGWRVMHSPASQTSHARSSSNRRAILQRDALRLVDRSQLATLARLLFVPQSISKALLNKLLLNLCENSLTRIDLLSLLVCILQDGSSDLAGVDRSFTELSLQPIKPLDSRPSTVDENVPNLITQRCLEILYYVVSWNDRSLAYFLSENDSLGHLKKPNRKGRHATPKYPLLVLIGLLDRPTFMNNTTLMEQLMNLLATICRCFPNLVKRYKARLENKKESEDKRSQAPLPVIPDSCLHKIVHVLSSGVCSSHAFQYTLSVLSHISSLDGTLEAIVQELKSTAEASGHQITKDLTDLLKILKTLDVGAELEGNALSQFSAATSHQTKLLRVLKAMDYLYTRKRKHSNQPAEDNEKKVVQIYESMDFRPLWKMLGQCLSTIQEREDLINVATVLLPLVESFMAVSKYSTSKQYTTKQDESSYFFTFTEDHKKILNIMVRNNSSLMSGSFSLLVNNPKILEFDNKRNYFIQQLHKRNEPRKHYPPLQLNVRRAHVFQDTYQQFEGHSGSEIKNGKLNVRFRNEEGVDAGGVAREWFSVLARQMFDPNYALFITSAADKLTYQPNRASGVNSDHLSYFKFVGRVIGKAIHDGRLLDAYFTRSFYKQLLGRSVDYRDVEAVDPTYYNSLVWMLENDITDIIDLTFSVETDDFGTNKIIDLKPNGRDIPVTEANKHEYVSLITEHKLVLAIKDQVNAFLQGFHDIIPPQLIQIFNEQELELLISGLPDIDIDEWKANTVYQGYSLSSPQIQWFWRAVRSFDQEEKAKLLQFSTGTSKVPLEGFAQLQGSNGVQKFQIHKEFGDANRLPSAHTW